MSTGFECQFIEPEPGRWFYILQRGDCPVGAFDWREYATAYGPFRSEDEAADHLHENHANPGGASVLRYREGRTSDATEQRLIDRAERADARESWRW